MWEKLRKKISNYRKFAEKTHYELKQSFKLDVYGKDWDKIDNLLDWQNEETCLQLFEQLLDEISGKKWHDCIMNKKQFNNWKEKIKKG